MKIEMVIDLEHHVNEEADRIGSREKVVWCRLSGQISTPAIPIVGQNIMVNFISGCPQPVTVTAVEYFMGAMNVLYPRINCDYVLPYGDREAPLEEEVLKETGFFENVIIPWFRRHQFLIVVPVSYSARN